MRTICPACNATGCEIFYEVSAVPTNSCLLIDRREDALRFPTGDIRMCFCDRCGFIFNGAWEPGRTIYSEAYETPIRGFFRLLFRADSGAED
jgi:hypothetical protein